LRTRKAGEHFDVRSKEELNEENYKHNEELHRRPRSVWEDNIKMDLKEGMKACPGLIWLRIRTSPGLM
jgi:hypothetical protein